MNLAAVQCNACINLATDKFLENIPRFIHDDYMLISIYWTCKDLSFYRGLEIMHKIFLQLFDKYNNSSSSQIMGSKILYHIIYS